MATEVFRPRIAVTLEQCWHRVPGGTARAALELVAALHATGRVELIGVAARHRRAPRQPWVPTIPVAQLPLPRNVLYETWHRFRRPRVQLGTGHVDAIHVTGLATPPRSAPIVVTLHDLAFLRTPESFTTHGMAFFTAALDTIQRDADLILCSSEATRRDCVDAGLAPERLRVVPLGANVPSVTSDEIQRTLSRFGITRPYVLHLGTDEPRKNRRAVLAAVERLGGAVGVVCAGGAGWGTQGELPATSSPSVIDLGFVAEAQKHALLAGASALCYPSFWEGFGLPVLEAMAHGTPVVTSMDTAMAEITGDTAWLVDPHDIDAISTALTEILDDPDAAHARAARGRDRAGVFTWENTAEATLLAYDEVIG